MNVQAVRMLDVVLFGPALLLLAMQTRRLTETERFVLGAIGLGTVLYNLTSYLTEARGSGGVAPGLEG